ncbi:hypothetical protein YB2330_002789 [Saitoella coloradoensis]
MPSNLDDLPVHLIFLIHGLWGNSSHMSYLDSRLLALNDTASLNHRIQTHICRENEGNRTYDGIDVCGDRVAEEIRQVLSEVQKVARIARMSVVGYSLGGLIARYALGTLEREHYWENENEGKSIEPVNFTTFATPHLGVRTPSPSLLSSLYNSLGSRLVSMSGAQLFLADDYHGDGRCLLEVMSDPGREWVTVLRRFKRREVFANVINDRTVPYYTASITNVQPDTPRPHTGPVIFVNDVNDTNPNTTAEPSDDSWNETIKEKSMLLLFYSLLPVWLLAFLGHSVWQSYYSSRRIREYRRGRPLVQCVKDEVRYEADSLLGVKDAVEDDGGDSGLTSGAASSISSSPSPPPAVIDAKNVPLDSTHPHLPIGTKLNLHPAQRSILHNLNTLPWEKVAVHIQLSRHSHAAIIYRHQGRRRLREGKKVVDWWLRGVGTDGEEGVGGGFEI